MLLKRLGVSRCAVEEGWRWVGWLLEMIGGKPKVAVDSLEICLRWLVGPGLWQGGPR